MTSSPVSPYYSGGAFGKRFGFKTSDVNNSIGGGVFSPVAALTTAGFAASAATLYKNTRDIDYLKKEMESIFQNYGKISSQVSLLKKEMNTSSTSSSDINNDNTPTILKSFPLTNNTPINYTETKNNYEILNQNNKQEDIIEDNNYVKKDEVERIIYGYILETNKKNNRILADLNSKIKVIESSMEDLFKLFEEIKENRI